MLCSVVFIQNISPFINILCHLQQSYRSGSNMDPLICTREIDWGRLFIQKERLTRFKKFFKPVLSFRFVCCRQRVVFVREIHPSTNHIHITCSHIIRPVHSKVSPTNDRSSAVSDMCYSAESDLSAAVRESKRRRLSIFAMALYQCQNILLPEARKRFLTILRPEGPLVVPNPKLDIEWPKVVNHSFEPLNNHTTCPKCKDPHDNRVRRAMAARVRREMDSVDLKTLTPAMVENFARETLFVHNQYWADWVESTCGKGYEEKRMGLYSLF
jgi:hypothetical protein